jgi:Cu/Ag efflux protein CusF
MAMKTILSATIFSIGIGFTGIATAQDVQGMSSGTTGTAQYAQVGTTSASETLKGEVATVDEASGRISIKMNGTVGSSDATTPTYFKVRDGLVFNAVKPGDKVSFTAERKGDEMTITQLTRE